MYKVPSLNFNSVDVRGDKHGNVCLTDLYKASGKERSYNPNEWLRHDSTQQLLETAAAFLNTGVDRIIISKRGKGGGTYAHKQIALAYAKYLSPALHLAVNQVFFERLEEEQNPEIAVDRAIKDWKRQGKSDEWIQTRLRSKAQRGEFTSVLSSHGVANNGVHDNGYRQCTNAIYTPLFGGGTSTIRQKKGLPKKASIRDSFGSIELAAVMLSEAMATENIKAKNLQGNHECVRECRAVSANVAGAVTRSLRSQPHNIG